MTDSTSTPAPGEIIPDEKWQPPTRWGTLRHNDTPGGRLVRLADVVRCLMRAHELPFSEALERVCAELEGEAPPLLYELNENGWAQALDKPSPWFDFPLPGDEALKGLPPHAAHARLVAKRMKGVWLQAPHELARLVNSPGHVVYRETKESPFEFSERQTATGGAITEAVPFAVAHALWGWGSVGAVDAVAPPPLSLVPTVPSPAPAGKLPQKSRAPEWTGEALARKRKELKLADPKSRNHTQQLAALTGLTPREITRREKDARDSAAPAKHAALRTSSKAA